MISKDNYEIWMMDYLDGTLSEAEQKLVLQFLEENPHLEEELEGLDAAVLSPMDESFDLKANLLKAPADEYGMEYPEYLAVKEVEQGLDSDEQRWKSSYLKEDKGRSKLFILYAKTILKADTSISYAFKGNIKRMTLIPAITVSAFKKVSAAAMIALLLSLGSMPLMEDSATDIKTLVVNDTPSLITMPKKADKIEKSENVTNSNIAIQEVHNNRLSQKKKTEFYSETVAEIEKENFSEMLNKGLQPLEIKSVNAYEVGLNAMMPIIIANNMADNKEDYLANKSQIQEGSQRLSRSARAIVGGVKVINFLSGNETKMNKVLNQDGQMVAYQVESDNISIRQRIKNNPVTN